LRRSRRPRRKTDPRPSVRPGVTKKGRGAKSKLRGLPPAPTRFRRRAEAESRRRGEAGTGGTRSRRLGARNDRVPMLSGRGGGNATPLLSQDPWRSVTDSMALESGVELRAGQSEVPGGAGLLPLGLFERVEDLLSLPVGQRL
jgi:hypothetical protein